VPGGFVEWLPGKDDADSYAISLAPPEHWDLVDCIAIVSSAHKATGSTEGHPLAATSPLYAARLARVPELLEQCRAAILQQDFEALATVTELDCHQMHAVMMTSRPPLLYWQPATLAVLHQVRLWRKSGLPVCYTIDAGPNVHVICTSAVAERIRHGLEQVTGVQKVLSARLAVNA
jgi:diphosphomevalonate decarboxylase